MPETQLEMSTRHCHELERYREEILNPLYERVAGGDEKNAKALADIIKIIHEAERKAFAFMGDSGAGDTALSVSFEDGD